MKCWTACSCKIFNGFAVQSFPGTLSLHHADRINKATAHPSRSFTRQSSPETQEMPSDFEFEPDSSKTADSGRNWLILATLASVQFTSIVDFMVVMPLGPQLREKLGLSPSEFGLIVASYSISAGIAGLLASSVMDRFGRKAAFLGLYSGFLVGTLFCGLAGRYATLLAARVVTGAFGGILGGLALTIVADVFPEERRGRATGVLMSAFALASAVGVPTGSYFGEKWGWNAPFLFLAGLGSILLIAGLVVMPPVRDHLKNAAHIHPLERVAETFRQPSNLIAFSLTAAVMFGGFSVIPYIALSLVANVGVQREELWKLYATGGTLTVIGAPLIGTLADRFGKLPVYRIVAVLGACLVLVITNLTPVPLALAIAIPSVLMVTNAGRMVAALAMITASVESRVRGGFMSANSAVQHLSSGLGAYIGGQILGDTADKHLSHFGLVGAISVAATLLSLWLAGLIRHAPEPIAYDETGEATSPSTAAAESTLDAEPVPER
jgi:predicted MFS family arabinose efflux permease